MDRLPKSSRYWQPLMDMIVTVNNIVSLKEQEQVLIVLSLKTDEQVQQWFDWLVSRLIGEEELDATANEIVQAAVWIGKGLNPNDRKNIR